MRPQLAPEGKQQNFRRFESSVRSMATITAKICSLLKSTEDGRAICHTFLGFSEETNEVILQFAKRHIPGYGTSYLDLTHDPDTQLVQTMSVYAGQQPPSLIDFLGTLSPELITYSQSLAMSRLRGRFSKSATRATERAAQGQGERSREKSVKNSRRNG